MKGSFLHALVEREVPQNTGALDTSQSAYPLCTRHEA